MSDSTIPADISPEDLKAYIRRLEDSLVLIRRRLRRYEDEFAISSRELSKKLQSGELNNRSEFAEWVSEHERHQRLAEQIDELKARLPR
nr:hypothetical protein [Anaerolineales bacterium]HRF47880.1 hypothetical protein [Anaerolineales bacterium]